MRHAARTDSTQAAIVSAMRAMGAVVWVIGLPLDLLVGYRGRTLLVECKSMVGKQTKRPAGYTPLQKTFMSEWKGGPVATVCDVDSAIRLLRGLDAQPSDEAHRVSPASHQMGLAQTQPIAPTGAQGATA